MTKELTFFKQEHYPYLKKEYEDKGYYIFSISSASNLQNLEEIISENNDLVIDLSVLASKIVSNDDTLFSVEQLLEHFHDRTVFISDKDDEKLRYKLRHCFDKFVEYKVTGVYEENHESFEQEKSKKKKIIDLQNNKVHEFMAQFKDGLYGHEKFKDEFEDSIYSFRVFNEIEENKIFSLFIMGVSGVGKTEVARSIHESLGGKESFAKMNFGNYSSQDALNSLIGSPRGYVGSDGGELFDKILNSDTGLILIDEFEKANTAVHNYFLDVLETGKATNSLGEELDLNGYIIVFTSNVDEDKFTTSFSPELRSRFDYIGYFDLLTYEDKCKYLDNRFNNIIEKYNNKHGSRLNVRTKNKLKKMLEVREYDNMRLLNTRIKEVFVDHLKSIEKI